VIERTEVIIQHSPLKRRVLRFVLLGTEVVLDFEADEERKTTRHRFRATRTWSRMMWRRTEQGPESVPQSAVDQALADLRGRLKYVPFAERR